LGQFQAPDEIFSDYAYFSSYSESWIEHGRKYTEQVVNRFYLNSQSSVVEIASNDGYLLQHFKAKNIPILGIEPAKNVAETALKKGIPTLVKFFGKATAEELERKADLIIGNNVLAHVPDLNDFVAGLKVLLKQTGVITLEFPHLLQLINQNQFDTIYHEHFSYFSLFSVEQVFNKQGLEVFDVEEIPTHGGSLRVYLQHQKSAQPIASRVTDLKQKEKAAGLTELDYYVAYSKQVSLYKKRLSLFLQKLKTEGKKVAGYGAPAKGNTLLNYCGITPDLLPFTVDRSPHKQGHYLPGTHIPIYAPSKIDEFKPDYLFILPWNLKDEIMSQMAHIKAWGGKFVIPIPDITIVSS
jgi:SAM-dependent methyltransferase